MAANDVACLSRLIRAPHRPVHDAFLVGMGGSDAGRPTVVAS